MTTPLMMLMMMNIWNACAKLYIIPWSPSDSLYHNQINMSQMLSSPELMCGCDHTDQWEGVRNHGEDSLYNCSKLCNFLFISFDDIIRTSTHDDMHYWSAWSAPTHPYICHSRRCSFPLTFWVNIELYLLML